VLVSPFLKALRDARRMILGWAIGIGAVSLLYTSLYPQVATPDYAKLIESYPEALRHAFNLTDVVSPAGYLNSTVFGLLGPVLLVIFMVVYGSKTIAGDEEAGTLDLVLAHPVSRTRLLLHRLAALVVAALLVCAAVLVLELAVSGPANLGAVGPGRLAAATVHLALVGVCFGALTLAVGAATGRRAVAVGTGAALAVLAYFGNNLAPQVSGLHWVQRLSPFYYGNGHLPLVHGLNLGDCGILLAIAAVVSALGLAAFTRRDIAV
jgi:ABC-2 type transport system permease protein